MESQSISQPNPIESLDLDSSKAAQNGDKNFQAVLDAEASHRSGSASKTLSPTFVPPPPDAPPEPQLNTVSSAKAIAAYKKQENQQAKDVQLSDLQKYKDDQLLSNPGGDHYYLEEKKVVPHPKEQESFWGRVGKDLEDAFSNVKNFFQNLLFGAKIRYRDENKQIQEERQRGFFGSVVEFFKDLGSAFSFGAWRPDGEKEPQGFLSRVGFFFSKIKEGIFGDLVLGAGGSVVHMGEDLIFAGWNALEAVPDASIGNFQAGKKLTTDVFDSGQVVLDYLTDILPTGEAWLRVHSPNLRELKPPILYNAKMPEHNTKDVRWRYVRNTPFRKAIETIGSLAADVVTLKLLGQSKWFSDDEE